MEEAVRRVYAEFDAKRKQEEARAADEEDLKMLDDLEQQIKKNKKL